MKRNYRMFICLVLVACLLLLSGCKAGGDQAGNNTNPQTEANNQQVTAGLQQAQNTEAAKQEEQVVGVNRQEPVNGGEVQSEENGLVWKSRVVRAARAINEETSNAYRMTYETWKRVADGNLNKHKACPNYETCTQGNGNPCEALDYFSNQSYSEAFFAEKTLIHLALKLDANNPCSLKSISLENGILTCNVEIEKPIRRSPNAKVSIFVEIDSLLPEETEIKFEIIPKTDGQPESEIDCNWKQLSMSRTDWSGLNDSDLPMILDYETYSNIAPYIASAGKEVYSEAFFKDHTVILVDLVFGSTSYVFEVSDLIYADGVMTCVIDVPIFEGMLVNAQMAYWYCFIVVDTVLPKDTQIKVDLGTVDVDEATYPQKIEQFIANEI